MELHLEGCKGYVGDGLAVTEESGFQARVASRGGLLRDQIF